MPLIEGFEPPYDIFFLLLIVGCAVAVLLAGFASGVKQMIMAQNKKRYYILFYTIVADCVYNLISLFLPISKVLSSMMLPFQVPVPVVGLTEYGSYVWEGRIAWTNWSIGDLWGAIGLFSFALTFTIVIFFLWVPREMYSIFLEYLVTFLVFFFMFTYTFAYSPEAYRTAKAITTSAVVMGGAYAWWKIRTGAWRDIIKDLNAIH